jgi:hypothetical protein
MNYYYSKKKCIDAIALMSNINNDLNRLDEIISDLSLYFGTHEIEDAWNVGIYSDLNQNIKLLDKGLQRVKKTLDQL